MDDDSEGLLGFAQRILDLLDGSTRVATYKLAILLALTDCCAMGKVEADTVRLTDLADRVLQLYWLQVRSGASFGILKQSEQARALIVDLIADLKAAGANCGLHSAAQVQAFLPAEYETCVFEIAVVLASQPLPKLQRPQGWRRGELYPTPLYDDSVYPNKSASRKKVRAGEYDLHLRPLVASRLGALAVLTETVAGISMGTTSRRAQQPCRRAG